MEKSLWRVYYRTVEGIVLRWRYGATQIYYTGHVTLAHHFLVNAPEPDQLCKCIRSLTQRVSKHRGQ